MTMARRRAEPSARATNLIHLLVLTVHSYLPSIPESYLLPLSPEHLQFGGISNAALKLAQEIMRRRGASENVVTFLPYRHFLYGHRYRYRYRYG